MTSHMISLYDALEQNAISHPGECAVVFEDHRYGFGDFKARVDALICVLIDHNVGINSRILWVGKNSNALLELLLACSAIGAILCPSNWRQSDSELEFILQDFEPSVVFYDELGLPFTFSQLRLNAEKNLPWISIRGEQGYEALVTARQTDDYFEPSAPDLQRPLLVLYTAAFDGEPCGAQLTEQGLLLQGLIHAKTFEIDRHSRTLLSSPNFHMVFWLDFLPTFLMGGRLVLAADTDASVILQLIHQERITSGTLHLPTAQSIAELNRDRLYDLRCFRSPLRLEGWSEMVSEGPGISGVGQTEVCGPVINGAFGDEGRAFSGRCAPMILARVIDDNQQPVAAGEVGELIVKGPVAGLGYWRRPDINRQRKLPGGWWKTRDLVRLETSGAITFIGPIAQMVKSGGENVYATEVENVLKEMPSVKEAGIIGIPDDKWGQIVAAVVQLHDGAMEQESTVQQYVKSRIARYKAPKKVIFIDEMPKLGYGIDYRKLDNLYGGGGYPGQG